MKSKQPVPVYGTIEWRIHQYERMKEANRGHNYRYYSDEWWDKEMAPKGWGMFKMQDGQLYTSSELYAKEEVAKIRKSGFHARIICGYHKTKQRQKFYTVIYRSKSKSK